MDRNVVIDQVYATGRFVHEKETAGQPLLSNRKPRFPSLKTMLLPLAQKEEYSIHIPELAERPRSLV